MKPEDQPGVIWLAPSDGTDYQFESPGVGWFLSEIDGWWCWLLYQDEVGRPSYAIDDRP